MLKRIFDVLVSFLGLTVLAIPLLGIAVVVAVDSPGPVFFRQQRVGRQGRMFTIFKFRTMFVDPMPTALQITVASDSRITKVGRRLRSYKLDELPQLINVLCGQMSVVGPRPEVPKYVAMYPVGVRETILSVRPGITDLASVMFSNENELLTAASNPEDVYVNEILPQKLKYYVEYVHNRSFAMDLRIIALTLKTILFGVDNNSVRTPL